MLNQHSEIRSHILGRIAEAPISDFPFSNITVETVLPPHVYGELRTALLPSERMVRYEAPHQFRYFYNLDKAGVEALSEEERRVLEPIADALRSEAFIVALLEKFHPRVANQAGHRPALIDKATVGDRIVLVPRLMLTRDSEDFLLKPHTDAATKVLTLLFYIPNEKSRADWGTEYYLPKDRDLRSFKSVHFDRGDFDLHERATFEPNSMVCFVKSDASFHGVDARGLNDAQRDLVILNIELGTANDIQRGVTVPRRLLQA